MELARNIAKINIFALAVVGDTLADNVSHQWCQNRHEFDLSKDSTPLSRRSQ